jgi:hypothetical protein
MQSNLKLEARQDSPVDNAASQNAVAASVARTSGGGPINTGPQPPIHAVLTGVQLAGIVQRADIREKAMGIVNRLHTFLSELKTRMQVQSRFHDSKKTKFGYKYQQEENAHAISLVIGTLLSSGNLPQLNMIVDLLSCLYHNIYSDIDDRVSIFNMAVMVLNDTYPEMSTPFEEVAVTIPDDEYKDW